MTFRAYKKDRPKLKTTDPEIVEYCKTHDFDALVTFNPQDFGKKKALYHDLLASGVSVVVLRPPNTPVFAPERQAALVLQHMKCIEKHMAGTQLLGRSLLRLSVTECRQRTIAELAEEIEAKRRLP